MRGNRIVAVGVQSSQRSIPAYAGEPVHRPGFCRLASLYPRVCGGTSLDMQTPAGGGYPRVCGGTGFPCGGVGWGRRSIPAYAGEP